MSAASRTIRTVKRQVLLVKQSEQEIEALNQPKTQAQLDRELVAAVRSWIRERDQRVAQQSLKALLS